MIVNSLKNKNSIRITSSLLRTRLNLKQIRMYSDHFSMIRRDMKTFKTPEEVKKEEQEKINQILGKPKDSPTDQLSEEEKKKVSSYHEDDMRRILLELDKRAPKAQQNNPPLWQRLRMTYILIGILLISFGWAYLQDRTHARMRRLLERDDY